jgi:glutathione peroxidase
MNLNRDVAGHLRTGLAMLVIAGVAVAGGWQEKKDQPAADKPKDAQPEKKPEQAKPSEKSAAGEKYVLGYKVKAIDGKEIDLAGYRGKVVMIINVASKCGLTKQYADLQKLYDARKDKGLVILAFPANNFNGQEPGTDAEISEFCKKDYGITFPLFSKVSVKGDDAHPLFKQLAAKGGGEPSWNFTKYLVDREGNVVQRFDPKTKPDDAALTKKIDELLAAKVEPKNG